MESTKKNPVLESTFSGGLPTHPPHPPTHPPTHAAREPTHHAPPKHALAANPHTQEAARLLAQPPPDTEHALTHLSLSACVPACVQRARARRTGLTPRANQTKQCIPGSPSQPRTAAAAALAQETTAHSIADLPAMSAHRKNLLSGDHF